MKDSELTATGRMNDDSSFLVTVQEAIEAAPDKTGKAEEDFATAVYNAHMKAYGHGEDLTESKALATVFHAGRMQGNRETGHIYNPEFMSMLNDFSEKIENLRNMIRLLNRRAYETLEDGDSTGVSDILSLSDTILELVETRDKEILKIVEVYFGGKEILDLKTE